MALFGRKDTPNIPEIDVRGDEFSVRQSQGGEPESTEIADGPDPTRAPDVAEHRGKIPKHTWGA